MPTAQAWPYSCHGACRPPDTKGQAPASLVLPGLTTQLPAQPEVVFRHPDHPLLSVFSSFWLQTAKCPHLSCYCPSPSSWRAREPGHLTGFSAPPRLPRPSRPLPSASGVQKQSRLCNTFAENSAGARVTLKTYRGWHGEVRVRLPTTSYRVLPLATDRVTPVSPAGSGWLPNILPVASPHPQGHTVWFPLRPRPYP